MRQATSALELNLAPRPAAAPAGDAARQELTRRILERRMTPEAMLKLAQGLARGPIVRAG